MQKAAQPLQKGAFEKGIACALTREEPLKKGLQEQYTFAKRNLCKRDCSKETFEKGLCSALGHFKLQLQDMQSGKNLLQHRGWAWLGVD